MLLFYGHDEEEEVMAEDARKDEAEKRKAELLEAGATVEVKASRPLAE